MASCRLSFLFTTDFVCLSPLSPILGTLWTETQHPPSPEQGLAPALEFQEISKVVWTAAARDTGQCLHYPALCKQRAVSHQHSHPVKDVQIPITDWHEASLSEPLLLLPEGHLHIHIAYLCCISVAAVQSGPCLHALVEVPTAHLSHSQEYAQEGKPVYV